MAVIEAAHCISSPVYRLRFPEIKQNDIGVLRRYTGLLRQCTGSMTAIQERLPYRLVEKWLNKAAEQMATTKEIPELHQLCKFLEKIKLASNPLRSKKWTSNSKRTHGITYQTTHSYAMTTARDTTNGCIFCMLDNHKTAHRGHLLRDQTKLKQASLENYLCYKCLLPGHISML